MNYVLIEDCYVGNYVVKNICKNRFHDFVADGFRRDGGRVGQRRPHTYRPTARALRSCDTNTGKERKKKQKGSTG